MNKFRAMAVCVMAPALCAQDAVTFHSETRLVEVDVVVQRKGKPVDNLTVKDFSLTDNHKAQRIATFAMRRDPTVSNAQPFSKEVVSNRPATREGERAPATVILIDTVNTDPDTVMEAARQAGVYLERTPPPGPVAVYAIGRTLRTLHEFSDDPALALQDVKNWKPGSEEWSKDEKGTWSSDLRMRERAEIATFALENIAKHLEGLPGRKRLLWISAAFTAMGSATDPNQSEHWQDATSYIDSGMHALNAAQTSVYSVDPRGLCTPTCSDSLGLNSPGIETMKLLSGGTGGQAFYGTGDIAGAMQEAAVDSSVTYTLGFYPEDKQLDGKYHDIRVKVLRDDVEVRSRKGYLADENKRPKPEQREKMLQAALERPLDITDIGVSVRFLPDKTEAGTRVFLVHVDVRDLQVKMEETKGQMVATASFTLSAVSVAQAKLKPKLVDVKLAIPERRFAEVLRDGYWMRIQVDDLAPYPKLRVAVQDWGSGKVGALTVTLPPVEP